MRPPIHAAILLALCGAVHAGPATTVAWNGHRGAVTFTFDDSYPSQLRHVVPAFDKRGIRATFFMVGSSWTSDRDAWIQAARDGHELGNHTLTHASLGGLDSAGVEREISGMADTLRAADSSIEAVTIAYPYCATTELIDRIADRQSIIARTCGWNPLYDPRFGWNEPPAKWMEATSLGITDTATVRQALTEIDRTDSAGAWLVTLNHGIMDQSYGPISDTALEAMLDRAIARKLWIATYQEVAAYWRASKVLDTARAVATSSGWTMAWRSPHRRMPRSVPLRVRFDTTVFGAAFTVSQAGRAIARESDGSCIVDFMALSLQVGAPPAGAIPRRTKGARVLRRDGGIAVQGLDADAWEWELRAADGSRSVSGRARLAEGEDLAIDAPAGGVSILRLRSSTGSVLVARVAPTP